jgi:hypothetical protein
MCNVVLGEPKVKKWDEKLDSRAAEKGAKKQVSSNCVKIYTIKDLSVVVGVGVGMYHK